MSNTLIELLKCSIRVGHCQEVQVSCSKSSIITVNQEGINVFDYSHNLLCTDKQIDLLRYSITPLKKSPATKLFKEKSWKTNMKNSYMTEMVLDPTLWPHNSQLMDEATRVVSVLWSPADFTINGTQLLAVLNCVGNINFYIQDACKWSHILDLSTIICEEFREFFEVKHDFNSLRNAAHCLATYSVCWASHINDDGSCYFVTVQRNGTILLWSLLFSELNLKVVYLGKFDSNLSEILNVSWVHKANDKFLLLCSEIKGQLIAFDCELANNQVSLLKSYKLWEHEDKMFVKLIHYIIKENCIIVIFNKNRHLVVQMYDNNMALLSQVVNKLNDYRITDFADSPDGLIVATVNCDIYRININIEMNYFNIDMTPIKLLEIPPKMELFSITLSKNNIFYILGMVNWKMTFRKEPDYNDIVFATTKSNLDNIMDMLLNKPVQKLTDCWDFIELLRYKIHKTNKMPEIDYEQLFKEGENDAYKLKIYWLLLIFYNELGVMKNYYLKMPETSIELVKEKLLFQHAVSLINNIYENYCSNNIWNENELEYICGAKNYLEFYCNKYTKEINDVINVKIFSEIKLNFDYICQCCDEKLQGFTCKDGHINMFCSLTFTPIMSEEYLFCRICDTTARMDSNLEPLCTFCDFRMNKHS